MTVIGLCSLQKIEPCSSSTSSLPTSSSPPSVSSGLKEAEVLPVKYGHSPVPLLGTHVEVNIRDTTAQVQLLQFYANPSSLPLPHSSYLFPLDPKSIICDFEAEILEQEEGEGEGEGGIKKIRRRVIKGEVQKREEAKVTYETAVKKGEEVFLLEQNSSSSDLFRIAIGNLAPKSRVNVKLTYLIELHITDLLPEFAESSSLPGGIEFALPTVIAPRFTPFHTLPEFLSSFSQFPWQPDVFSVFDSSLTRMTKPLAFSIFVEAQMPGIEMVSSPSHSIQTHFTSSDKTKVVVMLLSEDELMGQDFILRFHCPLLLKPRAIFETGFLPCSIEQPHQDDGEKPKRKEGSAMMVTLVPLFPEPSPQKTEYIFLVDRSGSMAGPAIARVKNALHLFLRSLSSDCYFNIISFGTSWSSLFQQARSVPYSNETLRVATTHVNRMDADMGDTEILQPLRSVYKTDPPKGYLCHIFLLTDGCVTNEKELITLVAGQRKLERCQDWKLFTVGIGPSVSRGLVEGLANSGNGSFNFVYDRDDDLEAKVIHQLKQSISSYSLLEIDWTNKEENFEIKKDSVRSIPRKEKFPVALHPGERCTFYAFFDDSSLCPSRVILRGKSNDGPFSFVIPVEKRRGCCLVQKIAARALVKEFEQATTHHRFETKSSLKKEQEQEAIQMALKYQIVSEHTSFIAVEEKRGEVKDELYQTVFDQSQEELFRDLESRIKELEELYIEIGHEIQAQGALLDPCVENEETPWMERMARKVSSFFSSLLGGSSTSEPKPTGTSSSSSSESPKTSVFPLKKGGEGEGEGEGSNLLQSIIKHQDVQGFFLASSSLAKLLKISQDDLTTVTLANGTLVEPNVYVTALVVTFLSLRLTDQKGKWELLESKARKWLQGQLKELLSEVLSLATKHLEKS